MLTPGLEAKQQARAQGFEPYPDNDVGPPVVGGRPREYQDPRSSFTVLRDMDEDRIAGSRLGEPILAPCPQSQLPPGADFRAADHHSATRNLLSAGSDAAVGPFRTLSDFCSAGV